MLLNFCINLLSLTHYQNFFIELLILSYTVLYLFCNSLSFPYQFFLIIIIFFFHFFINSLSKYLAYPFILGSFMHNDLINSMVLYPIKYLNAPFVPYESLLDNSILSISTLSMSIEFLS